MDNLKFILGNYKKSTFIWVNRANLGNTVDKMRTKHLYHTVVQIWNYLAPDLLSIHPHRKVKFPDHYTENYLVDALVHMYHELETREDINDFHINQLQRIADRVLDLINYNAHQGNVSVPPLEQ